MDKKQLEKKLSEIAEWVYPSVSLDNSYERVVPWDGKPYKHQYTLKPDMGPRIVKFRDDKCLRPCTWCGKICNQRQSITRQTQEKKNQPDVIQWHHSCQTCQRVWDPNTGELKPLSKSLKSRHKRK
jgi:hypothetical protein